MLDAPTYFNPLDRGNLYQISKIEHTITASIKSFNPLDRGNLYLIAQKRL